jgi:hypothetical protein
MLTYDRGLEYYIILTVPINYFDLIPYVELKTRMRCELRENGRKIVIANTKATDARLLMSQYYKEREEKWFDTGIICNKINDSPIDLTDDENRLRLAVFDHLSKLGDINRLGLEEGWYDYGRYY